MKIIAVIVAALAITFSSFEGAHAQSGEPIPVLVSIPITGPVASFGQHSRWGFELAFAQTNEAGGINGRPIEASYEDNRCNPAEAVKSVTFALSQKDYVTVLDGLCSSATLAIMPIIERNGPAGSRPISTPRTCATPVAAGSWSCAGTFPRMAQHAPRRCGPRCSMRTGRWWAPRCPG